MSAAVSYGKYNHLIIIFSDVLGGMVDGRMIGGRLFKPSSAGPVYICDQYLITHVASDVLTYQNVLGRKQV